MAIRESHGLTVNVSDDEIMAAQKLLGRTCGVFGEPAGVTGTAGLKKLCGQGKIPAGATVVSVVPCRRSGEHLRRWNPPRYFPP